MTFMIMDTKNYGLMLRLNFFIKMGVVVDVKKCIIQIGHGPGNNIQILPLNML
jgi:hypothetical protein